MTWVQTVTGKAVDLLAPSPDSIDIEDIATALGNICRYTGHTREHYSVAQHCVLCSLIVPSEHALQALMHDAVEAYVQDVSKPLKLAMRELATGYSRSAYDVIEERVDAAIARRFGLARPPPEEVKVADLRMLATEYRELGFAARTPRPWRLGFVVPCEMRIVGWPAQYAREHFLDRFHQLT